MTWSNVLELAAYFVIGLMLGAAVALWLSRV